MKILLDTHTLLWIASNDIQRFSPKILQILQNRENNEFFVSLVSIWEIAIKSALKKPAFDYQADVMLQKAEQVGIHILPITADNVIGVAKLPLLHKDPFDRLLIVQAKQEKLQLLTADSAILQYGEPFILDTQAM